jgi:hypothetical protein
MTSLTNLRGVNDPTDQIVEYLSKFEPILEKALFRGSGAQMEFCDEKTMSRKCTDGVPNRVYLYNCVEVYPRERYILQVDIVGLILARHQEQ